LPKFKKPKSLPKLILLTVSEAVVKLVFSPIIVLWRVAEERYCNVPKPSNVDWRLVLRKAELTNVAALDKYPNVANPVTVERRVESKTGEEMRVVVPADK
jgi:hypothetical protein